MSVRAGWAVYFRKRTAVSFAHTLIGTRRFSTRVLQKKGRQDEELFVAVRGLGCLLGVRLRGRWVTHENSGKLCLRYGWWFCVISH